jgi:Fis family transcriptional regulator
MSARRRSAGARFNHPSIWGYDQAPPNLAGVCCASAASASLISPSIGLQTKTAMEQQATAPSHLQDDSADSLKAGAVGPIRACVTESLRVYFQQLNGHDCDDLYQLVLTEVEIPLLESVMSHCGGNQTKAAQMLGINRGTLRKKLQQYGLG